MKQENTPENEEAKITQKAQSPQDLQSEETPPVASEVIDEDEPMMEIGSLTEEPIELSLERVAQLKSKGNYEVLEYHIRRGEIELLPTKEATQIVTAYGEHQYLMHAVKCFLLALRPMLEKQKEIASYIDPESKIKINAPKIMEELMGVFLTPGRKKPLPIWSLLQNCFDMNAFAGFPTAPVKDIVSNQGFDLQPYLDLAKQLGLFDESKVSNTTEAPKSTGMKPEDKVAFESISDVQRERYLLLADEIAHSDED